MADARVSVTTAQVVDLLKDFSVETTPVSASKVSSFAEHLNLAPL